MNQDIPAVLRQSPQALLTDRRRPGRTEVAPELIPLLRARPLADPLADNPAAAEQDWSVLHDADAMAPARGLVIGLLLAIPFWAVLGGAGYLIFR